MLGLQPYLCRLACNATGTWLTLLPVPAYVVGRAVTRSPNDGSLFITESSTNTIYRVVV